MKKIEVFGNCLECGEEFLKKRKDQTYCSITHRGRASRKRHYENNPQLYKTKRVAESENVPNRMLTRCKSRAKRSDIPFNLEVSDIIIPDVCPILGIELVTNRGVKGYYPDSASLDKINPSLGYVKGNVRVISARANLLKNNATVEELERVLWDLKQLQSKF